MKKILLLSALFAGALLASGCGGPTADEPPPVTNPDEKPAESGLPAVQTTID